MAITLMSCNCGNYNYTKAIKEDTERIFRSKKSLIRSLGFKGIVDEKEKCDKCNFNKYTIRIKLEELSQEVSFQDKNYPPYYSFSDKLLSISVNQNVFDKLKKGDFITKAKDSRFLESNESQLEILNAQELVWCIRPSNPILPRSPACPTFVAKARYGKDTSSTTLGRSTSRASGFGHDQKSLLR